MGNLTTHGAVLFILFLAFSPLASGADSPPCMAYAYTLAENEPHASLIVDSGYVFGTQVVVVSNCDNTTILVDGMFAASSPSGSLYTYISAGEHSITLTNDGFNQTSHNVTFIESGQLAQVVQQLPTQHNPYSEPWTPSQISSLELVSGIGSILISWLMVVGILWRLINTHHDRNYCMEVV